MKLFSVWDTCNAFAHGALCGRGANLAGIRHTGLKFADPGKERQDSVFNGLQTIPDDAALVCVHDAARPLVSQEEVYNVSAVAIPKKRMLP